MLERLLKSPAGIAGIIVLAFGLVLGLKSNPKSYEQQRTMGIADPYHVAKIKVKNAQKKQEREEELIFIWGSIGFGLLMLGNAVWKASRRDTEAIEGDGEGNTGGN